MALQVEGWNGKVVTMEMDPVNASHLQGEWVDPFQFSPPSV